MLSNLMEKARGSFCGVSNNEKRHFCCRIGYRAFNSVNANKAVHCFQTFSSAFSNNFTRLYVSLYMHKNSKERQKTNKQTNKKKKTKKNRKKKRIHHILIQMYCRTFA